MDTIFKVEYGAGNVYQDVTTMILQKLHRNGTIFIPPTDVERAHHLGDPLPGVLKEIIITFEENHQLKQVTYPAGIIGLFPVPSNLSMHKLTTQELSSLTSEEKLQKILQSLIVSDVTKHPGQLLASELIHSYAKVLEIGGNTGEISLVIASLLEDDRNLVSVEYGVHSANILECHKRNNQFRFAVETSIISDHGSFTWSEFMEKYQIQFDTLFVNCGESLYNILNNYPKGLYGINLVIIKNDYPNDEQKLHVDAMFQNFGLEMIRSDFYEVWMKIRH
ncbi:Hypothetical protein POVR1_LOCUS45 [uncultured virus]|nr:Hypothetical protein POVR1_LOCUS45 [uncultured virus]